MVRPHTYTTRTATLFPYTPLFRAVGCPSKSGTHMITDEVFTEIVDKDDLNVSLEDGDRGAIIYTHLWRESRPMIRFAPGDESYISHEPFGCGRDRKRVV